MSISARLRALVETLPRGVSLRAVDRRAGLREGTLQKLLSDEDPNPGGKVIGAFAEALGATTDWLLLGRGDQPPGDAVLVAFRGARGRLHVRQPTSRDAPRKRNTRSGNARAVQGN